MDNLCFTVDRTPPPDLAPTEPFNAMGGVGSQRKTRVFGPKPPPFTPFGGGYGNYGRGWGAAAVFLPRISESSIP